MNKRNHHMRSRFTGIAGKARRVFTALFILSCAMIGTRVADAATLKVPGQFATIQAAVDAAAAGDTILVADGTYAGTGNHDIDFHGKGLTVKSSGGPANCIIDCRKQGRAFYLHSDEKPACRIEGFTMTNASVGSHGGGIYVGSTIDCTAVNCVFKKNSASEGGGGMYYGKAIGCVFAGNSSIFNVFAGFKVGYGGGGYHTLAAKCTFTDNVAYNGGGGIAYGTAIECVFTHNVTTENGGGVYQTSAINCAFADNRANGGGGIAYGTALNCVFSGNHAESSGGGAYNANLIYCTLAGNAAARAEGGGVYVDSGDPIGIVNCVIWGNTSGAGSSNVKNTGRKLTIDYSDVEGGFAGTGNISADPRFVNAAKGDLHLKAGSPCIDAAKATKIPAVDKDGAKRVIGPAPDMGAFEFKP